jgi:hypothetical protein
MNPFLRYTVALLTCIALLTSVSPAVQYIKSSPRIVHGTLLLVSGTWITLRLKDGSVHSYEIAPSSQLSEFDEGYEVTLELPSRVVEVMRVPPPKARIIGIHSDIVTLRFPNGSTQSLVASRDELTAFRAYTGSVVPVMYANKTLTLARSEALPAIWGRIMGMNATQAAVRLPNGTYIAVRLDERQSRMLAGRVGQRVQFRLDPHDWFSEVS